MLRDLNLKPVYDSAEHDIVKDLMVPLLNHSVHYLRGVGFFTSGWLKLAAHGIKQLIENGGKAHYIVSPKLAKADWEAFQWGDEARCNEKLKEALSRNIDEDIALSLERDTRETLAWMIADGLLEFRFAVARSNPDVCDYHDKVGIYTDIQDDVVAIHGSFNESMQANLNGEAFSVFKSWELGQRDHLTLHQKRLNELWNGANAQFLVYKIPDNIRHKFIKLRQTTSPPYNPDRQKKKKTPLPPDATVSPFCPFNLYPYQQSAIKSWVAADCRGIFEMATGTGKTITSLAAAVDRYSALGRLVLVILVPYLHLLEQWERTCIKAGFSPLLCSGNHSKWNMSLKSKIDDFNIKAIDNLCIIAVHKTAASDAFAQATQKVQSPYTMLIGDEAHGLGAPFLQHALIQTANMRLGLSATPARWFDETGSQVIRSYFSDICFTFSLEEAIGKYLVPYEYMPELVSLSSEEMERYEELTDKIVKIANIESIRKSPDSPLKKLLIERARIIGAAEQKLPRLLLLLRQMVQDASTSGSEISHILIYCAPGTHKEVLIKVSEMGLRCHEFVHDVILSDRQKVLDQFAKGEIQILVAIKCLDEGVDVPSTRVAFFLASTSNPKEFVQRRGRVLRLAEGKDRALLYDFIVVPQPELRSLKRDIDASLLRREMPRFAEFSSAAINLFAARSKLWDILDQYDLLHLFDKKPADIYHAIAHDSKTLDINE